jgi:hypothetical protein
MLETQASTVNLVAQPSPAASSGGVPPPELPTGGMPAQLAGRKPALHGSSFETYAIWQAMRYFTLFADERRKSTLALSSGVRY